MKINSLRAISRHILWILILGGALSSCDVASSSRTQDATSDLAADVGADARVDTSSSPDVVADTLVATPDAMDADADVSPTDLDSGPPTDTSAPLDVPSDVDMDIGPPPPDPPPAPQISDARVAELSAQLDAIFSGLPTAETSALIIEAESGRVLYSLNPDQVLVPASNTKLVTTAAALSLLGPDYRFTTRVYGDAAPDAGGGISGDLHVVVEGDFTWSDYYYATADVPLQQIADALHAQGVRSVSGDVWIRGEVVYDGYRFGYLDPAAQRIAAATALRSALVARGISVGGAAQNDGAFAPPAGVVELTSWRSVSLVVACSPINTTSHNEFADALFRHLGFVFAGDSSFAGGSVVVMNWLDSQGLDPATGITFSDGSGLSYANMISAQHLITLMQQMDATTLAAVWPRTFSVTGVRGTLTNRMTGPDTFGRVFAKSGTLNITIATSGVLVNRHDGRRYLFSFLMNQDGGIAQSTARSLHNQAVEALAVDLLGAGARPDTPTLRCVQNLGDGSRVQASWSPSSGAQGYFVWVSDDGERWSRDDATYTEDLTADLGGFAPSERVHVRLTAVSTTGESDPSDVYVAGVSSGPSHVLLVDGEDRWQRQPVGENTLDVGHDFLPHHGAAITNLAFDACANEAVIDGQVSLSDYDAVIWAVGEDSQDDDSLDADEQSLLQSYLQTSGGALFISGAEIGWDLVAQGAPGEPEFFTQVLGAAYLGDDAGTYLVRGSGGVFSSLPIFNFYTPAETVAAYPDQLGASNGSVEALQYVGGGGGVAGVQLDAGSYRVVMLGFPFECIDNADDRAALMDATLAFFGL